MMRGWLLDLTYSLRSLRKSPGFTLVAVLCLGLGIGVNASIFSLLNFVYLRPLAVSEPDRLVVVSRAGGPLFSYPDYRDYRDRNRSFVGLGASLPTESSLDFEGASHTAGAEAVSANYPEVIGVHPFLGRWFSSEDEPAAVLSYHAWQRMFNGDPNVLGKRVRSETQWYTVVGIAPEEFTGTYLPLSIDLWVPLRRWAQQHPNIFEEMKDRARERVFLFARLKPGVAASQAAAELNAIAGQIRTDEDPRSGKPARIAVERVRGLPNVNARRDSAPVVTLLMTVVGLVLLIACVNVGNLLVARGAARQRELSVRAALGAGRLRVLRQLMTESLVLALFGGAAGLAFGALTSRMLEALVAGSPYGESVRLDISSDARVLIFTAALSFATTLFFGLAPAWRTSRTNVMAALKGETPAGGRFRLRRISLVGQVAVSLVLLLTSGLFLRTLLRLHSADPGFAVQQRLYAMTYVSPPEFTVESGRHFYAQTLDRIRALPGVRSASLTSWLPLQPIRPGCVSEPGGDPIPATDNAIDAGFLETMRITLVAGRDFNRTDRPDGPPVAIVNETLARRFWPHQPAIGKRVLLGCRNPVTLEIIGVARDSKFRSLGETTLPHVYRPFIQDYGGGIMALVIETATDPASMIETVRKALVASSAGLRLYGVRPLAEHVEQSYWTVRWEASALGVFGCLALLLAAVGLYGVVAYHVTLRTREIGIRMAIGAERSDVLRLVLGQGLRLTLMGIVAGLFCSAALARLLENFLYGISPTDLLTYTATALVWLAVALAACYLPARRASRVQPLTALRHE